MPVTVKFWEDDGNRYVYEIPRWRYETLRQVAIARDVEHHSDYDLMDSVGGLWNIAMGAPSNHLIPCSVKHYAEWVNEPYNARGKG